MQQGITQELRAYINSLRKQGITNNELLDVAQQVGLPAIPCTRAYKKQCMYKGVVGAAIGGVAGFGLQQLFNIPIESTVNAQAILPYAGAVIGGLYAFDQRRRNQDSFLLFYEALKKGFPQESDVFAQELHRETDSGHSISDLIRKQEKENS